MKKWSGRSVSTIFLDVDDPLEWDLISHGSKCRISSRMSMIPIECESPCFVMMRHQSEILPALVHHIERRRLHSYGDEEASEEGCGSIPAWKRHWCRKNGIKSYTPTEEVWSYIFEVWDGTFGKNEVDAAAAIVNILYPSDQ